MYVCPLLIQRSVCSHTHTNRQWPEFAARLLCNTPADKTPLVAKERTLFPSPLPFALSLSFTCFFFSSLCLICTVPTLLEGTSEQCERTHTCGPAGLLTTHLALHASFSLFLSRRVCERTVKRSSRTSYRRKTSSLFICTDDCVLDVVISFRFQLLLLICWARHLPVFISCLTRLFHVNTSPWNGN